MRKVLVFAAVGEAATGLALLVVPSLVGRWLLGEELTGIASSVTRVAGIALMALGVACWPGTPLVGMLTYSATVTLYLLYLGIRGEWVGPLLWPAVALHAILTLLLARSWLRNRAGVAVSAAVAIVFALLLSGSSFVYATRVAPGKRTQLASPETAGPFGEVIRGPRGKSEIALTFDGGAEAECFEDLIAALESAHVNSTFFITGRFTQGHADCAAEITKHGHEIGNHTWSHLNLTEQSDDVVRDEILRAERAIVRVSGQSPRPRWRAPYGVRDERVLKIATNLGYRSIYWTLDSLDGVEPAKNPQFLVDRVTSKNDAELDGAIILMHVGVLSTADALPAIIANLQGRGFRLVTISKLLESSPKPQ